MEILESQRVLHSKEILEIILHVTDKELRPREAKLLKRLLRQLTTYPG